MEAARVRFATFRCLLFGVALAPQHTTAFRGGDLVIYFAHAQVRIGIGGRR